MNTEYKDMADDFDKGEIDEEEFDEPLDELNCFTQEEKIKTAKLDENGKVQLIIYYENDPGGAMAYFIDNDNKKIRITNAAAYKLLEYDMAVKINDQDFEWLPKNYDPGLSVDDWFTLLTDEKIFTIADLEMMKRFQDCGGEATCTQLSSKYGETWQFYSNKSWTLGDRISKKTGCPIYQNENDAKEPWTVLFLTRKANKNEAGSTVLKIRDELAEALSQMDLSHIKLYSKYTPVSYDKNNFLNDVYISEEKYSTLVAVLKNKKNIILQGAPGVGKTFAAKRLAYSMMGETDGSRVEFVQFHQNYSYEDFVMGYKPTENNFELKYGIFYNFCQKAAADSQRDYFFIIDEINRC